MADPDVVRAAWDRDRPFPGLHGEIRVSDQTLATWTAERINPPSGVSPVNGEVCTYRCEVHTRGVIGGFLFDIDTQHLEDRGPAWIASRVLGKVSQMNLERLRAQSKEQKSDG